VNGSNAVAVRDGCDDEEREMDLDFLQKAAIGAAGMAIGAALVTLLRIAAVDGVDSARTRYLAEIASGRTPAPRVVARATPDCPRAIAGDQPHQ
jgi:hypothetical protein